MNFPHVGGVIRIERYVTRLDGSQPQHEVTYGVTSISGTGKTTAKRLLKTIRGHWTVENGLHWVRDVTFDEDRSQIRTKNGPRMMASLRNLAISLLRLAGTCTIAKATRWCDRHLKECMRLIGLT